MDQRNETGPAGSQKKSEREQSPRRPYLRRALLLVLLLVSIVAAWYCCSDWIAVRYHFWRLMASRSSPRFHRYYAEDFHAEPAWALGARGTAGIDYLLRKMGNGTDAEKLAALAALGRLGSYWEVSDYAEQLLTSKDAMLQSYAATALYKYSRSVSAVGTVSRAAIQTCIESDNITIFDTGLHMLLEVRPDGMDELLATALRRSAPHFFRFRALARLRAVTGVGKELRAGPRTMKTLRELAKLAPDPNDRKTAAEILEDLNVPQEKETGN